MKHGLTLIEIMVIIAIASIVAALGVQVALNIKKQRGKQLVEEPSPVSLTVIDQHVYGWKEGTIPSWYIYRDNETGRRIAVFHNGSNLSAVVLPEKGNQ